jgi:hypothetical protein
LAEAALTFAPIDARAIATYLAPDVASALVNMAGALGNLGHVSDLTSQQQRRLDLAIDDVEGSMGVITRQLAA